jgi:putative membrane protein
MKYGTPEDFRFKIDTTPPPAALPIARPPVMGPLPRGPRWGRWALGALGLFVVGALLVQAVDFIAAQWARSPALGGLFTALLAAAAGFAVLGMLREARAWRELEDVERVRAALLAGADAAEVVERLAATVAHRPDAAADVERFRRQAGVLQQREHLLELFANEVLRPLDRAAYAAVARAARDAGALTALAPTALLDTLLLLWRNLRMIREVAAIYGHRTGLAGTWFLVKRLASGAAIVAAADVAGSLLVHQLGNAVADLLAAKVGEGAIAGARTARIGLWTMQLCRAVPFAEEDVPTLRKLAASLLR